MRISGLILSIVTCTEAQVAENGVGISQLHQILLHCLALLRPCTWQLQLTVRLTRMRIICRQTSEKGSARDSCSWQRGFCACASYAVKLAKKGLHVTVAADSAAFAHAHHMPNQRVSKRYRLSWLTNSALLCEPKSGGGGGAGSQPMSTAVQMQPK